MIFKDERLLPSLFNNRTEKKQFFCFSEGVYDSIVGTVIVCSPLKQIPALKLDLKILKLVEMLRSIKKVTFWLHEWFQFFAEKSQQENRCIINHVSF